MTVKERVAVLLATAATLLGQAHALPQSPNTVATSGANPTFTPGANTLTIDQSADRTVIDWGSFAIAPDETVTFNLPSGTAIAVNRVPFCALCSVPPPATLIEGALVSNGNVWLLDPRGVFFGATAQVDVHGLLASPADLLDLSAFVNGALNAPIAFAMPTNPGPVAVQPGAQIVVRGGPALFVGAIDGENVFLSGLDIAGSVVGGGTAGEQASSQVLYGAAQGFTLRLSATPPNAMGSSDLQLFDFIVDAGVARTGIGAPVDAVRIGPSSTTRAGAVFVAGAAVPLRDPTNPDDPVQFRISGPLESTSGPLIVNGAGGISGGAASGLLANAEIDVLFDRAAFEAGPSTVTLGPLVDLRSSGGMDIAGRSVRAFQRPSVGGQFPVQPVPDHTTVQFSNTSTSAASVLSVRARDDVFLQNSGTSFAGSMSRAVDLSGASVTVQNSLGSPTFGAVTAQGAILVRENLPVNGAPAPAAAVDFTFGALNAGTTVTAATRGAVKLDSVTAVTAELASAGGDVTVVGATTLSGAGSQPALQVTAGDAVSFGAVTSVRDVFVSAGGEVTLNGPVRVTAAVGPSTTATGIATLPGLDIRAGDLDLQNTVFVRGVAGAGVHLALTDAGLGSGLGIDNADIQRFDTPLLALRVNNSAEMLLSDFTLDASRIGRLVLATNGVVRVQGTVTGVGAPELIVGDGALLPARIEISGALGALAAPLGRTSLNSAGAILIGTPTFLSALQGADLATVDLTQFGIGFGGAQPGQIFLAAAATTFSAPGAILQQNTGGLGFDGVRFAVPSTAISSGVFATAPTRIALFGRVKDRGGAIVTGAAATSVDGLLANGVAPSNAYRINGCIIGQVCASAPATDFDPTALRAVPPPGAGPDAGRAPPAPHNQARRAANSTNAAIEVEASDAEFDTPEEARAERDPGVGAANEDLWPSPR